MSENQGTATSWANPGPAGIISLGFALMIFFALLTGRVPPESHMVAGLWLLGCFVIQVSVGLIDLRLGSSFGGNTFLWFGAFFCLATGLVFVWEYFAHIYGWPVNMTLQGYLWICIWIVMWLCWPVLVKCFPLTLGIVFCIMNLCAPLLALMNLHILPPKVTAPIIGWAILPASLLSLYSGASMVVNMTLGKELFPLGRPILKQ